MAASPPLTRSSQSGRSSRTRQALLAAGLDLLVDRPIDAIPIDDLVAAAEVAKGSFFNHFADKQAYADAVSAFVREDLEAQIDAANAAVSDPLERLAGGMTAAAVYAFTQPRRTVVMLRGLGHATARNNPLNRGVIADVHACAARYPLRAEAAEAGVLYWLGLCHVLMVNQVERRHPADLAEARLGDLLVLGLTGLGLPEDQVRPVARSCRSWFRNRIGG